MLMNLIQEVSSDKTYETKFVSDSESTDAEGNPISYASSWTSITN